MFDEVIITAANRAQANGYCAQTKGRDNFLVFPDPGDRRVGSLGATVNALRETGYEAARRRKVLIVHSGGDARRTPGYAAMGKAFVPLRDGRPMLDHIVSAMERLRLPEGGGVVVVSGDVLPVFEYEAMDFSKSGVTGVAYPDGPEEARRHGVYVVASGEGAAAASSPSGAVDVVDFVQKPPVTEGTHLIDTGVMFIDGATAERMKELPISGDIYEEFPKMLLEGYAPFRVNVADESCEFFHIGSTRELLTKLGDGKTYVDSVHCRLELGGENVVTNVPPGRFQTLTLAKGECFTCIPYDSDKWLDLKYRIDDNFKSDGLWEKHNLGDIMKRIDYSRLLAIRTKEQTSQTIRVKAPVRIDFAGGWSDTPPICNNEGGTVLNAAVTLEGRKPIEVTISPRRDKFVKVVSRDLGKRRLIKSAEELADHADPHDWCALVKSALAVTGFEFGSRGINITISADLPKGSGMGTSSILGAAVIAAILGRTDTDEICELTLRLEAEMRTGGGWQDQFGGVVGGVKLLSSQPGQTQQIAVERLANDWVAALMKERGLLFFTGQKRMARNILRKVLAFYAENPHDFAKILVRALKTDAEAAADAIRRHDADALAAAVNGYWRDKKLLDPGSTNERVEDLIERIKPYASAVTLTGAGGGGFMFILAKSADDAAKIRSALTDDAPTSTAKFYDFDLSQDGLELEIVR